MSSHQLLILLVSIFTFDFILDQVLDYLNLKHQQSPVPDELKEVVFILDKERALWKAAWGEGNERDGDTSSSEDEEELRRKLLECTDPSR